MGKFIILCIFVFQITSLLSEINLPVDSGTQQRLSLSLKKLSEELQFFRTPYENKINLFRTILTVQRHLQQVSDQVSQYDNVMIGSENNIEGCKNIIVGSFNTINGSNNYVFMEKYSGKANGDLLIGKWRIEIQKKNLILMDSNFAISFINEETNRKYLRYLTQNIRPFQYGSNSADNIVTLVKEYQDTIYATNLLPFVPSGQFKKNNDFNFGSSLGSSLNLNKIRTIQPQQIQQPLMKNISPLETQIQNNFYNKDQKFSAPSIGSTFDFGFLKNTDIIQAVQKNIIFNKQARNQVFHVQLLPSPFPFQLIKSNHFSNTIQSEPSKPNFIPNLKNEKYQNILFNQASQNLNQYKNLRTETLINEPQNKQNLNLGRYKSNQQFDNLNTFPTAQISQNMIQKNYQNYPSSSQTDS